MAQGSHQLSSLDMGLEKVLAAHVCRLVAEDPGQLGVFGNGELDCRPDVLLLCFATCLPLNVPGRALVEVVIAIFRHDSLLTLCSLGPNLGSEIANLLFCIHTSDTKVAALEPLTLLFQGYNLRVWWQTSLHLIGNNVTGGIQVLHNADICH